jgi:hypothetical protein
LIYPTQAKYHDSCATARALNIQGLIMLQERTPLTYKERRRFILAAWLSLGGVCLATLALVITLLVLFPGQ